MTGQDADREGETTDDDPHGDDPHDDDSVTARYREAEDERVLAFDRGDRTAVLAQNSEGYAMVSVRRDRDGDELERYYGFEMALDHAAELLGVTVADLPVPAEARDMGM